MGGLILGTFDQTFRVLSRLGGSDNMIPVFGVSVDNPVGTVDNRREWEKKAYERNPKPPGDGTAPETLGRVPGPLGRNGGVVKGSPTRSWYTLRLLVVSHLRIE